MQRPTRVTPHLHTATSRALAIGLAINALLLATELIAGWAAHSSGLLADTLHAAVDLAADGLLLVACRMDARLPPGADRRSSRSRLPGLARCSSRWGCK